MLSCIVAVGPNNEIGANNDLIYKSKEDMGLFVKYTTGKKVIMGYKTWKSLRKPVLPNRENLVVLKDHRLIPDDLNKAMTEHPNLKMSYEGIFLDLLPLYKKQRDEFVIMGGGRLYELTKNDWDVIYITKFKDSPEVKANVFFPGYNTEDFLTVKYASNPVFEFTILVRTRRPVK